MMTNVESASAAAAQSYQWPSSPYKGLSFYLKGDVPLFAGREDDIVRCSSLLNLGATRILVLHGTTGCGKSSFLRAGLIPHLEGRSTGFKFLDDDEDDESKALFVRSTDNPLVSVAEAIYNFASNDYQIETPIGTETISLSEVLQKYESRNDFLEQAGKDGKQMVEVLRQISSKLSRTLILIIDQGEEVLTLRPGKDGDEERCHFFEFMSLFSRSQFDLKLLVALRTEYFGKFYAETQQDDSLDMRHFYLRDLTREQLIRAIERPTMKEMVFNHGHPFDQYQFSYEEGLAGEIADDLISRNLAGGVLPVLQIVCDRLYLKTKPTDGAKIPWVIKKEDYHSLRGIEEQLDDYIKQALVDLCKKNSIPDSEIVNETARWRDVLCLLAKMQVDGTVTTEVKPASELATEAKRAGCKLDFQETMRLLSSDNSRILRYVKVISLKSHEAIDCYSLGHDAIGLVLLRWKVAREELKASQIRERQSSILTGMIMSIVSFLIAGVIYAFGHGFNSFVAGFALMGLYSIGLTAFFYLRKEQSQYYNPPYWAFYLAVRLLPTLVKKSFVENTLYRERLRQYPDLSGKFEKYLESRSAR